MAFSKNWAVCSRKKYWRCNMNRDDCFDWETPPSRKLHVQVIFTNWSSDPEQTYSSSTCGFHGRVLHLHWLRVLFKAEPPGPPALRLTWARTRVWHHPLRSVRGDVPATPAVLQRNPITHSWRVPREHSAGGSTGRIHWPGTPRHLDRQGLRSVCYIHPSLWVSSLSCWSHDIMFIAL